MYLVQEDKHFQKKTPSGTYSRAKATPRRPSEHLRPCQALWAQRVRFYSVTSTVLPIAKERETPSLGGRLVLPDFVYVQSDDRRLRPRGGLTVQLALAVELKLKKSLSRLAGAQ